jgi:HEAT repeat protein
VIPLLLGGNVVLTAVLFGLVALRKVRRDRREARSSAHRAALREAILHGGPELDERFTRVRRSRDLQLDLAMVLPELLREDAGWVGPCVRRSAVRTGLDETLARRLRSRRPVLRGTAALLTGLLGLDGATDRVRPLLQDHDGDVQLVAAGALARLATGEAANALVDAMTAGRIPQERLIERLGEAWAVPVLRSRLATSGPRDVQLRTSLARALGLAGAKAAEPDLLVLLARGELEERVSAARALATCGTEQSHAALVAAMDDEAWEIRAQAATSLGELGVTEAVEPLERALGHSAWWVRSNAGTALAAFGPRGLAALRRAADSHDRYAAERAQEVLTLVRRRAEHAAAAA